MEKWVKEDTRKQPKLYGDAVAIHSYEQNSVQSFNRIQNCLMLIIIQLYVKRIYLFCLKHKKNSLF